MRCHQPELYAHVFDRGPYTVCLRGTLSHTQSTLESSTWSGMDTWLCQLISIYQYLWLIVRCHCHWAAYRELTLAFYAHLDDQHFSAERLTALDILPLTLSVRMVDSTEDISDVLANLFLSSLSLGQLQYRGPWRSEYMIWNLTLSLEPNPNPKPQPITLTALDISPLTLSISMADSTEDTSDVSANLSSLSLGQLQYRGPWHS